MEELAQGGSSVMPMKYCCFLVSLFLSTASLAQQWFAVSGPAPGPSEAFVEIDLDSIRIHSQGADGIVRVSFDAPRSHEGGYAFRSFVASAQFDCQRRSIVLASAAYFQLPRANGARVGADSSGRDAGMPAGLVDSIPQTARQSLLRAACNVQPN